MGIPKLLILKQLFTKPTKSHFNLTRTLCSVPTNTPLSISPEFVKFVTSSPRSSVIPLLEQYFNEDKNVLESEVPKIIRDLRKRKLFDRALEVLEWANRKPVRHTDSGVLSFHLDLIGKVRGIAPAEKFFEEANDHSEKMYSCLLNFYVQGMLVDKSLSLFEKMKEMGIASSPLTYNKVMSLYLKNRLPDKLLDLLLEMQDKGVSPDEISYKLCLKGCALTSDFDSMDKLVKAIKDQHHLSFDWLTYATVASYYLDGGHPEKAITCLQIAEDMVRDRVGYNFLISSYAKLGDVTKVTELWQKQKDVCKSHRNHDYMVMLSSLMKFDMFEQAEGLLEECRASSNEYNHCVVDALLSGYVQKGLVEKAEKLLEDQISKNTTPVPISWGIISEGYIKCQNMQKAVQCMEKALRLGPQQKGWAPKRAVISNILTWLGQHGDNDQVYEFLKLMSRVAPMNKNTFLTLKASSKHGKDVNVILQRLKDDNIDVDEETSKL
ncbi:pentatricopeptide repeat-containing protein At4g21705, mitochondrial-like [Silene latifolia]|uniref:pentatricopeptide repeat-containing protein At4g21705, mitochondrial-like n=1 Tax=Silene latifolia TaxID=37657 RepID=UPI003D774436